MPERSSRCAGRMSHLMRRAALGLLVVATAAGAESTPDRVSGSGYFRLMTRPDLQGGDGQLGYSNLYGRLMNETSFAEFNLFIDLLQAAPGTSEPWARMGGRVAFTGFRTATAEGGSLGNLTNNFQLKHFFLEAGNVFLKNVTWRFGTFDLYYNDLGLYDYRPSYVFLDTLGLGATYQVDKFDLTLVAGDAGFEYRTRNYNTILTTGGRMRYRFSKHFELGVGGQYRYEPSIPGSHNSPYQTPNVAYADFLRGEVVQHFDQLNPGQLTQFPNPVATTASSYTTFLYAGFGGIGPLQWNNFYVQFQRLHPDGPHAETYLGQTYNIYATDLTNKRYELNLGTQAQFVVVPNVLDGAIAGWYSYAYDLDNTIAPSDHNRTVMSTVLRLQAYLTTLVHYLVEGSAAHERSSNGNNFRDHADSIFQNTQGSADSRGFEYGDSNVRNTFQFKTGFVLNPSGRGIFARPSIRLLYGLQYSTQQAAYGNGFVDSLNQYNVFTGPERHWHSVVGIEAEGWF